MVVKRIFDFAAAALGLVLLSPLLLLIALLVKLTSPGPVFYRAARIGRGGRPIQLLKFRSMVAGGGQAGPGITRKGDPRITPIGRKLRNYKLDELPQLVNVVRGEMSLVGPRPEDPRYVALYTPAQRAILAVRPGITSAASLAFRHEEAVLSGADWEQHYREKVMPAKLAIDLAYLERRTFWSDLGLIVRTIGAMGER